MRRLLPALVLVALGGLCAYLWTIPGFTRVVPAILWVLDRAPAGCDHLPGQWAGFVQESLPASCTAGLAEGPRSTILLQTLLEDDHRPLTLREAAVRQLIAARADPAGYIDRLLAAATTPPDLRRALLRASLDGVRTSEWSDMAARIAVHGLYDEGLLRRWTDGGIDENRRSGGDLLGLLDPTLTPDPQGLLPRVLEGLGIEKSLLEEGVLRHQRGQSVLHVPAPWRDLFWRYDCADGCLLLVRALVDREREPDPEMEVPAALDLVWPERGEVAEHVTAEIAAVARWISEEDQPQRLIEAVLRPRVGPGGGLHEVLRDGAGDPGASAFLALELGRRAEVPVEARWDDGVLVGVGGRGFRLAACGGARPGSLEGEPLSEGQVQALLWTETAGVALRAGTLDHAASLLTAANAAWPDGAPLRRARAVYAAMSEASLAGPPGRQFLPEIHEAPRRKSRVPPPPLLDARLLRRAEAEGARIAAEAASTDPADRIVAAWWALTAGREDTARALLPGPTNGYAEALRIALLRRLAEPGPEPGPVERPCDTLGLWPALPS